MPRGYSAAADLITATTDGTPLNTIWQEFAQTIAALNTRRGNLAALLCYPTTQAGATVSQTPSDASFEDASEFGEPQSLRTSSLVSQVGFPFKWRDLAARFTWRFLADATREQVESVHNSALEADNRQVFEAVMRALLTKTSAGSRAVNEQNTQILPLWDGEADATPPPYLGTTFAAGHQHYLTSGAAVVDSGDIEILMNHVLEHGYGTDAGSTLAMLVNPIQGKSIQGYRANVANANGAVASFDFVSSSAAVPYLTNLSLVGERPPAQFEGLTVVGSYGPALIIQDPLVPVGYVVVAATAGANSNRNPLAMREKAAPSLRGLIQVPGDNTKYPLVDSYYLRGFGVGVQRRGAAAVMQITANASYTSPAI